MASVKKAVVKKSATKKATTTAKKTVKKAVVKKKATVKSTDKKTSTAKRKAAPVPQAADSASLQKIDPEHRRRMIAETSYFIAERRGFMGGSPADDWIEAEILVDRLLESNNK